MIPPNLEAFSNSTEQAIAVGIILNANKEVFVAIRPDGKSYAGMMEFPGGKVERDENISEALKRELLEEIGITIKTFHLFSIKKTALSANRLLNLHFYLVEEWENEPFGKEGQTTLWHPIKTLDPNMFPPANQEIVLALQAAIN